jgi:hypothetical protein
MNIFDRKIFSSNTENVRNTHNISNNSLQHQEERVRGRKPEKQINNDVTMEQQHKPKVKNFKIKQKGRHFSDNYHMTIEDEIAGMDLDNGIDEIGVAKYEVRNWKYHLTNNHF